MYKFKGSMSSVKMKYLIFVFAAAMLVALPTRVYQLLAIVDCANGFYNGSDITVPVLYGAIFIFALIFMALSFVSKEVPSPKLPTGKNPILGVSSLIMVVGLGWDILTIEHKIIPQVQGGFSFEMFKSLVSSNLEQNGGFVLVLEFIFAIFAIFYFLIFAVSHLNGKASYKEYKLLALSPLCWAITMLISRLMMAVSFIKVSELLFEIFMLVFAMLFFLTFARISSNVFTEDSMWGIYGYGFSAALFAGLVTIPRLVCTAVGLPYVEGYEFNFAHLAILLFVLSYIVASLGVGFKNGFKNMREIAEVKLPDDESVVVKHSKASAVEEVVEEKALEYELFEEPLEEIAEETEAAEEPEEAFETETSIEEEIAETDDLEKTESFEENFRETISEDIQEGEDVFEIASENVVEDSDEEENFQEEIEDSQEGVFEERIHEPQADSVWVDASEDITEEYSESVEDTFEENAEKVSVEAPVISSKSAKKPKKDKKSLLGLRKAPVVDEAAEDDLKPISLADMKKKQQ